MAVYPNTVTIEYYNGIQWVDISSYVVSDLKGNQGFEDVFDRVAYLGLLELQLDNRGGLFMPMGGDAIRGLPTLTGFNKGAKIRVSVTISTHDKVVWIGRIDSLDADDGIWEEQRVRLLAVDWFDVASRFPMKGSDILLEKNINEAMESLLARMSIQPEDTDIDTGTTTFPAVFEDVKDKTKAIAEINKLTLSELGFTYLLSDGTLRVEDSSARKGTRALDRVPLYALENLLLLDGDDFFLLDGDTLLLNETEEAQLTLSAEKLEIVLKNAVINRGDVRAYPVRTDTSLVNVFRLGSPIYIPAGQTVNFTGHYTNPNGGDNIQATNQQLPVATTDYLMNDLPDGTGNNITSSLAVTAVYYGDVVEYSLTNFHTAYDGYVTQLNARGYGVYYDSPISAVYEDEESINAQGEIVFDIDQKYKRDLWDASVLAKSTVEEYKNPKLRITSAKFNANINESHMMAFLYLDIGSLISIYENKSGITKHYYILSRSFTITRDKIITVVYGLKENLSYLSETLTPIPLDFGTYEIPELNFGHLSKTSNLPQRSVTAKIYTRDDVGKILYNMESAELAGFEFSLTSTNRMQLYIRDTVGAGVWKSADNSITLNAWHTLGFTKEDNKDPLFYIDGLPATVTETSTPSGPLSSEDGLNLKIGDADYIVKDVRMYDDILTPAEMLTIHNNDAYAHVVEDNLVFQSHFVDADYGDIGDFTGQIPETNVFDNIYKAVAIAGLKTFANRTWTLRTTPNNQYHAVTWSPSLGIFVAVGDTAGTSNHIMTSPNGINWTARSSPNASLYDIAWSPELNLFAAVGTPNVVLTSPDGIAWTQVTPSTSGDWKAVVWAKSLGKFVALSQYNGATQYITSPTGVSWTGANIDSGIDRNWVDLVWSEELGLLVGVGETSLAQEKIITSTNGTSWTERGATSIPSKYGVTWSPLLRLFVAVGFDGSIDTSPDGTTWTTRTSPTVKTWREIEWSHQLHAFVAISNAGTDNRSMYSLDGITWYSLTTPGDYAWLDIVWSSQLGRFVAVSYNTSNTTHVMTL
jgi:hypothetical protein